MGKVILAVTFLAVGLATPGLFGAAIALAGSIWLTAVIVNESRR